MGKSHPQPVVRQETACLALLISTPEDPEPSPMCHMDWIAWCARHILMLSWWEELVEIPNHDNYQLFARKVHASFEVPKV